MADISKITLPNGASYDFKDSVARSGLAGKAASSHTHTKSQITDFPSSLPANGGNADTLGGLPADTFMRYEAPIQLLTSINDMVTAGTYGVFYATPDFPTGYGTWGFLEVRRFGSICYQTIIFDTGKVITRAITIVEGYNTWTEWHDPYTNIDKPYVTGVVTISGSNDTNNQFRIETNHGFAPSGALCWNVANNIVYCCYLSGDEPNRFIYLNSTEAIKNGNIFEYIIFK